MLRNTTTPLLSNAITPQAPTALSQQSTHLIASSIPHSPKEEHACDVAPPHKTPRFMEWTIATPQLPKPQTTIGIFPSYDATRPSVALIVNHQEVVRFYEALGTNPQENTARVKLLHAFCRAYLSGKVLTQVLHDSDTIQNKLTVSTKHPSTHEAFRLTVHHDTMTFHLDSTTQETPLDHPTTQGMVLVTSNITAATPSDLQRLWAVSPYDIQLKDTPSSNNTLHAQQALAQRWETQLLQSLGLAPPNPTAKVIQVSPSPKGPPNQTRSSMVKLKTQPNKTNTGLASYYNDQFRGHPMASGQRYNPQALTVAHRSLPFGTWVRVTNTHTGKSCLAQVTDRGPFHHTRIVDVSKAVAKTLGMLQQGVIKVWVDVVPTP
ncbi:MAG: septal ring lytic transglycosylase RlpA family protein [Vampirovibrionales bacterium]